MTSWISITRNLMNAYGVASVHVGPPFSVYRTNSNSSGNIIQPQNLMADNVRVDRQVMKAGDKAFEGTKDLPNFWYKIMANCNSFLVGDIFFLKDLPLNRGWDST